MAINKFNVGDTVRIKSTGDVFTVTGFWWFVGGDYIYHENDKIGAYEDKLELVVPAALPDAGVETVTFAEAMQVQRQIVDRMQTEDEAHRTAQALADRSWEEIELERVNADNATLRAEVLRLTAALIPFAGIWWSWNAQLEVGNDVDIKDYVTDLIDREFIDWLSNAAQTLATEKK